ncbi:hypothetical protein C9374_000483 [Naegleria lovaniensis]|uniref:Uncharacterized protein n=1 Tax=Naegleria lovaniensis TaxID=51637 RepID=A0AA88GYE9_NAELO|nr:uncharacterized protein C9374_000483 [Naegleria lovaniensis]KAG2388319.1 hypothetical protein C9374_000483 [Naegleria lovaniensis]
MMNAAIDGSTFSQRSHSDHENNCWKEPFIDNELDEATYGVKIILIYLLPNQQPIGDDEIMDDAHELIRKLTQKMGIVKRKAKPFSTNFELVHTFGKAGVSGNDSHLFNCPFDVKISYSRSCILISDSLNSRIQVFDIHTKELRASIPSPSKYPLFLCVEENYDGKNNDALIFGCEKFGVFKYDLNDLLEKSRNMETCKSIWTSQAFVSPQGIVLLSSKSHVYICDWDEHNMKILNVKTGELVQSMTVQSPYGIDFSDDGDIIISELDPSHKIQIFRMNDARDDWQCIKSFGKYGQLNGEFDHPFTLVFDKAAKHIIVSDNYKIQIFEKDGSFLKSFGGITTSQLSAVTGICLNELTGELLVCDSFSNRVLIFK